MRKFSILFILLFSISVFAKGNRQDDPSYQVDHNRTKNFSPTYHYLQEQIEQVGPLFSGMSGDTFTINNDLADVTSKLIFGRTTGGNAEISWDGTDQYFTKPLKIFTPASAAGDRNLLIAGKQGGIEGEGLYSYIQDVTGANSRGLSFQTYKENVGLFEVGLVTHDGSWLINATSPIGSEKLRVNGDQYLDGTASLDALILREKSSDPADPAEGQSVIWQSDGTGAGDDGDLMVKITAGGVTKTTTLVDFSGI